MGIVLQCPLLSENSIYDNNSNNNNNSENENNTSLYSQPSLPSVPSLQLQQTQNDVVFQAVKTLSAHSSYISSLVLAGDFLFSSSSDGTVRLWPITQPSCTASSLVVVSTSAVKFLVVSGDKLFTAHQDHKVRVWRIAENDDNTNTNTNELNEACYKCVATLPTLNDRLSRMFSSKNYVAVRRHKRRTWVHHNDAVSALAATKDGSTLYTASWDRSFKVWRASDFHCLESVPDAHDDAVNALALTDDGLVFTGSADRKIKVWQRRWVSDTGRVSHSLLQTLEKHRSAVNALAVSTDGRVLYSGACDRSILVWHNNNNNSMVVVGALRGHNKSILSLGVVGDIVCSGSADCSVRVWKRHGFDNKTYACLAVLQGHSRPVKSLSLALDTQNNNNNNKESSYMIYSGALDCEIRVWKILVPTTSNYY